MAQLKSGINEQDRGRLIITGALLVVFLSVYTAYAVGKFQSLSARALIRNNVVMKVIQHNVNAVCPKCGSKGVPMCPTCKVAMFWNGFAGNFVCPACGQMGFPVCPRCKEHMTWIEAQ
ncbi:MAG: hypothetical protein HQL20_03590 [Candidatus Omnitrophica bacterium]|nr:hypothetical protein [Candidatus Omnitrophota bacterium]